MAGIKYNAVSIATILRDHIEPKYINKEHKMLCDIADCFWNADLTHENLKDEYKELYGKYSKEWWALVFKDMRAIDSQISGHEQELMDEYAAILADY